MYYFDSGGSEVKLGVVSAPVSKQSFWIVATANYDLQQAITTNQMFQSCQMYSRVAGLRSNNNPRRCSEKSGMLISTSWSF